MKSSFAHLKPVKVTIAGEKLSIPAHEFARICPCAVQGSRASVLEKAVLSKLGKEYPEALQALSNFIDAYKDNKPQSKPVQITPEQEAENRKRAAFVANFDSIQVGSLIYDGQAKSVNEAEQMLTRQKQEAAARKAEKERQRQISIFRYNFKPYQVETNEEELVASVSNGRTNNWGEMTKSERQMAIKLKPKSIRTIPLTEYISICPCNVKIPNEAEVSEHLNRYPQVVPAGGKL